MLDLNDVRNFVIVARRGTLRAAAGELRVPTSTVARSITRLESHLNVSLLRRSARGVLLTDCGTEFLRASKQALRTIKAGSERLQERRANPSGLIRVASPMVVANSVLLPTLPDFLRTYPELRIELETYTNNFEQSPREDVDIFFTIVPPKDSSRRMRRFPTTLKGLFASTKYVRRAGSPGVPKDLLKHDCIGAETWTFVNGPEAVEVAPAFRVTTFDPLVMREMVLADIGVAVLPLHMARQPEISGRIVQILPKWLLPATVHSALYFGSASVTPKIRCFLDFAGEIFGTHRDPRIGEAPFEGLFGAADSRET